MDEILRESLPDTTSHGGDKTRTKGPEELQAFDRCRAAEDAPEGHAGNRMAGVRGVSDVPEVPDVPEEPEVPEEPQPEHQPLDEAGAATDDAIPASEAEAAVAAGEQVAMVEDEIESVGDDEGLPAVPELADLAAIARVVFVLMLTQREGMTVLRLAQAANTTQKLIEQALEHLRGELQQLGLPVELSRTGDSVRWLCAPETFPYLQRLRGVKKLEKLSAAALETLAVIAYRQPVMRAEIEAIRGVKAGPMLRTLLQHKLVRVTGRADVPGRPLQYGTTQQFLERFGLSSLQELPSVKEFKQL